MLPVVCMARCVAFRFHFEYSHAEVVGAVILPNGDPPLDAFNGVTVKSCGLDI